MFARFNGEKKLIGIACDVQIFLMIELRGGFFVFWDEKYIVLYKALDTII
jgi:hypothetical protein